MLKTVAILQMIFILYSVSGVNVFKHICHHSGTVAVAFSQTDANCSDHLCCQTEHIEEPESSCCSHEHQHILTKELTDFSFSKSINAPKCCEDASSYFVLSNPTLIPEKSKNNISNSFIKIDFDLPFFHEIIEIESTNNLDYNEIRNDYLSKIISYIYFSSQAISIA